MAGSLGSWDRRVVKRGRLDGLVSRWREQEPSLSIESWGRRRTAFCRAELQPSAQQPEAKPKKIANQGCCISATQQKSSREVLIQTPLK
jgi:hypothetical protein